MKKYKVIAVIYIMCIATFTLKAAEINKSDTLAKTIISQLNSRHTVLSTNIIELLVKGPNIMYEQIINGSKGLTAKLVYDVSADDNMLYLESSYRWYIWKPNGEKALTGLAVGPYLKMTQQLGGTGKFTIGAGAEAAFKWIWYEHYALEPSITLSYPYVFDLRLGFGYAF
jgi:hypothetical protein